MSTKTKHICRPAFEWLFETLDKNLTFQSLTQDTTREGKAFVRQLTYGGFKFNATTLTRRKDWLFGILQQNAESLEFFLEKFQAQPGPWHGLLPVVQSRVFRHSWRLLLSLSKTPGVLVLALAGMPEDSWQKRLAFRLVKLPSAWAGLQEQPGAEGHQTVVAALQSLLGIESRTAVETAEDEEKRLRLLDAEYRRGRQDERQEQEQKAAEERRARERRLKEQQAELDAAKAELQNAKKTLNATVRGSDARFQEQKARLETQFQQSLNSLFSQYFAEDHELEYQVQEETDDAEALVERLNSAARQQLAFNQSHGSKQALKEQRRALANALDGLQSAAADAIVPIAGLPALMGEASRRIKHIESILADDDIPTLAVSQLHATILSIKMDAQADQAFEGCRQFVAQAVEHDILSPDEAQFLEDAITRRQTMFHSGVATRALEQNLAQMAVEQKSHVPKEIWNLAQYQRDLLRVTLIFDGYNAMKRNSFWLKMEASKSFEEARRHFIHQCSLRQGCFQNTIIVFDGSGSIISREKVSDRLSLIYAPQINDAHNADDAIVATANMLKDSGNADLIWIVTDDYGLRNRLEDICDAFVETRAIPRFFLPASAQ